MRIYKVINGNGGTVYQSTHYGKALHQSRMLGYALVATQVSLLKYLSMKMFLQ